MAPSVITKRVSRLEHEIGSKLFVRSTRRLSLTARERLRPRLQLLMGEMEDTLKGAHPVERGVVGRLRIKAPTTAGALHVGPSIARFQAKNPNVTTELVLIDRSVNPFEEGFDIALGALPSSYANVLNIPLREYDRVLVAAPRYLARNPALREPTEIVEHECLAFLPVGLTWAFASGKGAIVVDVHARFSVNENSVPLGLTVIPRFLAREALADGRLVELLPNYPLTQLWFKALVPRTNPPAPGHLPPTQSLAMN